MKFPNVDDLDGDYFTARKVGPYYEILNKETQEVVQTKVNVRLPRKRFDKPIRNKAEALSALMGQEIELLKSKSKEV